jgi:hypothetical protein
MIAIVRLFRSVALILIAALFTSTTCAAKDTASPIRTAELHQKLVDHGIGKRVRVTQIDGVVVRGTLVSIGVDSFEVTPKDTTQPTRILNTQVHKFGSDGLPTGAKVAIGIAAGFVGVLLLLGVLVRV